MVRDIRQRSILNGNDPTVFFINNIIPFSEKIKLVKIKNLDLLNASIRATLTQTSKISVLAFSIFKFQDWTSYRAPFPSSARRKSTFSYEFRQGFPRKNIQFTLIQHFRHIKENVYLTYTILQLILLKVLKVKIVWTKALHKSG